MKISITKFTEQSKKIEGYYFEHTVHDEVDHLHGVIEFNHEGCFPLYMKGEDKWYSYDDEEDSWGEYEMEFNYRSDGKFDFGILGDGEDYSSFYLYNPIELNQFISFVTNIPKSHILNKPIRFKEFKLNDVINNIYITVKDNGKVKLCDLNVLKKNMPQDEFSSFLLCLFEGDWDFLLNIGNWNSYCKDKNLSISDDYNDKISILYNNGFINTTKPYIDFEIPHLAFEISSEFSSQYFFDLMYYSNEGLDFMKSLHKTLVENISLKSLSISGPKDLLSQILYSASFRLEYNYYLHTLSTTSNLQVEQMMDLKATCINRRENFQDYILNKENSDFLNSLKHPLPFILDKTLRSYSRATNDFDRQTYGGRLFNYILRSIVLYPLQELIYLKYHKSNSDINKILNELKSGKPISDGTWVTWFNEIAKIVGKDSNIELNYFRKLITDFQKLYNDIQKSIPKRNDWAHYREHSAEYQKHLDEILPNLLSNIRNVLKNIEFIYIEKQEYKSEKDLCITAKRVMGFEIDIETIEFSTKLAGNHFISKKLYAYKPDSEYTIPLEPFLNITFESVETIRMGIFDNIKNGGFEYAY